MSEQRFMKTCPVGCDAPLEMTDYVLPEGALLRCTKCGQLLSSCTQQQYTDSNLEWDTEEGTWPSDKDMKRLAKRRAKMIKLVSRMLKKSFSDIRLLDVGCSSGATVWIAKNMGLQAEGVEPMKQPIAKAQEMGLNIHHGLLHEIALPDNSFDVLTLFEVVEHLDHPINLLNECHRILRPGGILVIGTGNTTSWTQKVRGDTWDFFNMKQYGGHISFFNYKSIAVLAENTGFSIAKIKTSGVKFFQKEELPYLLYRLSKLLAEILNLPAILFKRGHQMEAYLIAMKEKKNC